jgi:hypothetical protein
MRAMRTKPFQLTLALLLGAAGCTDDDSGSYTLYRDSVTGPGMRLHIATFDSKDGEDYNRENCRIATTLFQEQPGVRVKYWCEKGRFRR